MRNARSARHASLRGWALLAATIVLAWAGSVYTPWAADLAPRLWLYDLVFYLRFVVLAAWIAEVLRWFFAPRDRRGTSLPLVLAVLCASLAWTAAHTGIGLRLKIAASTEALVAASIGTGPGRHRAGHVLVDAVSRPCRHTQPWLWLGRPHGGGTGTSLAVVRTTGPVPDAPAGDAHRFWAVGSGWWVAYHHAGRFVASRGVGAACTPGVAVSRHRQGLAFVDAGWREFPTERTP